MFYFRVVATAEGFECRRGRDVIDRRATLDEALNICRALAAEHQPSAVYLHNDSGGISLIATFNAEDPD